MGKGREKRRRRERKLQKHVETTRTPAPLVVDPEVHRRADEMLRLVEDEQRLPQTRAR